MSASNASRSVAQYTTDSGITDAALFRDSCPASAQVVGGKLEAGLFADSLSSVMVGIRPEYITFCPRDLPSGLQDIHDVDRAREPER